MGRVLRPTLRLESVVPPRPDKLGYCCFPCTALQIGAHRFGLRCAYGSFRTAASRFTAAPEIACSCVSRLVLAHGRPTNVCSFANGLRGPFPPRCFPFITSLQPLLPESSLVT